jgi:hypothetical protein
MATLRDMAAPPSPPARRPQVRRDLRLAAGGALVLVAMVLGARLLAGAGDRTPVWSLRVPLAAGTALQADDLVAVDVGGDATTVAVYVAASDDVIGRRTTRDLAAGELLPAASIATSSRVDRRLVTVAVDPLHAPPSLARGERVDVYVTPRDGASVGSTVSVLPTLVLAGALVSDPGSPDASGASAQVGVVLDVAAKDADRAVAAARAGDVDLVRVGS